jgi:predicted PhzF superfamily epimerase YddE/YHI9
MKLAVKQVDAFTTKPFCGNPAGVITEADGLTLELMQKISAEMNLSESAFISSFESDNNAFRIRFFTPSSEVDISGHVLIASCYALIEEERILLNDRISKVYFETNIGRLPVEIFFKKGRTRPRRSEANGDQAGIYLSGENEGLLEKIMMTQRIDHYRQADIPVSKIADILGISEEHIIKTGLPLEIISTGLNQLMVPVYSKEIVRDMHPDLIKLGLLNRKFDVHTNHIFTLDTPSPDCVSYARHFAPAVGMWEDPATGTASAGLGTYLLRHGVITSGSMMMEQGNEIDNLGRILVEVNEDPSDVAEARIGGLAVTSISREISLENDLIVIT